MSNGKLVFWAPLNNGGAADSAPPAQLPAASPVFVDPDYVAFEGGGARFHGSGLLVPDFNPLISWAGAKLTNDLPEYVGKRFIIQTTLTPLTIKRFEDPNPPPVLRQMLGYSTSSFGTQFGFRATSDVLNLDLMAIWFDISIGFQAVDIGLAPIGVPITLKLVYNNDGTTVTWWRDGNPMFTTTTPRLGGPSLVHVLPLAGNNSCLGSFLVSDTKVYTDFVDFVGVPRIGAQPLSVQFTDLSLPASDVSAWLWDFGDGHTGTTQNPLHVYEDVGVYTVSLTATIAGSMLNETKIAYITVTATPVIIPPEPVLSTHRKRPLPGLPVVRVVDVESTYS